MIATVVLPLSLLMFMVGLGSSLTVDDFRRVLKYPKAAMVGLTLQILGLPLLAALIIRAFGLDTSAALGLVLIAVSPSGPSANFFSFMAKGDVALAVTLTAVNSLSALLTVPLVLNLALGWLSGGEKAIHLPIAATFLQVACFLALPMGFGMLVNAKRPGWAAAIGPKLRQLALALLLVAVVDLIHKTWGDLVAHVGTYGAMVLGFMVGSMLLARGASAVFRLPAAASKTLVFEVVVHNATQAMTLASSPLFLNSPTLAIPSTLYAILMYVVAGGYVALTRKH